MRAYPSDVFEEMDLLFDRIFSRFDRESGIAGGYRPADDARYEDETEESPSPCCIPHGAEQEVAAEVHRAGDEVIVTAELPGIGEDALRLAVRGSSLRIDAGDADRHFRGTVELPPVDPGSMRSSIRNGVLEVTFRSAGAGA